MKSFKQHIIESTVLVDLINKHDNPFEFLAAAMNAMKSGKLNLKKRGAANARELVRAWNKLKQKKINVSEAVEYITEYRRYDKGRIIPVAQGLNLIATDPKTGKDVFIMSGNKKDREKMEKFAKQYGIELEK